MQRRFALFTASTLAVFLTAGSAHAASIKGKDLSTVPDILRHARGLTGKEVSLELRKDSVLRLHDSGKNLQRCDSGYLDLRYNIGNGDRDSSLGRIPHFAVEDRVEDVHAEINGMFLKLAQTKFNGNKVVIASSVGLSEYRVDDFDLHRLREFATNWLYELSFNTVSKNDGGG